MLKGLKGLKDRQVLKGLKELIVFLVQVDRQGLKVQQEVQDLKDLQVLKELQVHRELVLGLKDLKDLQVLKERKEHKVLKDQQDLHQIED